MSFKNVLLLGSLTLCLLVGVIGLVKKFSSKPAASQQATKPTKEEPKIAQRGIKALPPIPINSTGPVTVPVDIKEDFPEIDRIDQLFTTGSSKLPIVETITYSSSVSWHKGKPAWIADYAAHFMTSRHFIARSLNGKPDYFAQKVVTGSRFNVLSLDRPVHFHLLVDISKCKMGFYYVDLKTNERVLLKTYNVGLGKLDEKAASGTLTPLGRYFLGDKVAVYKPGSMGYFQDKKVEMIRIFGTRWIPFAAGEGPTATSKGYGIQGAPWTSDSEAEKLVEASNCIGKYESNGCIVLNASDMEELFSIVITRPTFVDIVKKFQEAKLPGVEVASPSR